MIEKALRLNKKKWHYAYSLFEKKMGRLAFHSSLEKLKIAVSSQLRLLKKIAKAYGQNRLLMDLEKVLEQQKRLFSRAKVREIISKEYSRAIFSMEEEAIHLLKREQELVSRLSDELPPPKKKAAIRLSKKQAAYAAKAISSVNRAIRDVSNAIGSRKEVQRAAKALLKQIFRLQHTEVYGYLKDDANNIRKAAKIILENPGKAKLRQMLAGIYLVAPFSFDASGAVIILRYAAKYANAKSSGLQKKIKAIREKRKRHLKIF